MRYNRSSHRAYSIFTTTLCQGTIPAWYDENGLPVTYATEREAQIEIVGDLRERLRQFLANEADFEDAIAVEDFILAVDVWPDGSITVEGGPTFRRRTG